MNIERAVCDFDLIVEPMRRVPNDQWDNIVAHVLDVSARHITVRDVAHIEPSPRNCIGDDGATEIQGTYEPIVENTT